MYNTFNHPAGIFLVKRPENEPRDYDEYDSFVCVAIDEKEARRTSPGNYSTWSEKYEAWVSCDGEPQTYHGWTTNIEALEVTRVGDAADGMEVGIVCASFNAG